MWAYYSYWSGLDIDDFQTYARHERGWAAAPTNDGLTMLVVGCPAAQAGAYRANVEATYLGALEQDPAFADRVRAATREERFYGGGVPNFFRRPYGPGWALVGDAGYTRDPITAQGISDAFRDAELCSAALDAAFTGREPFAVAMDRYHRARDEQVMAVYEFTTQLATLDPPPLELQQLLAAIEGNQPAADAFVSLTAGTLSPAEFFAPRYLEALLAPAGVA
jgi:flavin-dependent dehydrogenase